MTKRQELILVSVIALIYFILAIGFSLGPIFEGPDEIEHYRFIRYVARTWSLPDREHQGGGWESHQPPLYYALAAPIKTLLPDDDFDQVRRRLNLYFDVSRDETTANYNKNRYLHPADEAFPYTASTTAFSVHMLRLLSVAMGIATLVISYLIVCEMWPDRADRRLTAFAIIAFWPLAIAEAGLINNDNAMNLMSALTLLLILRQVRLGSSWGRSAFLGVVLGLACLAKASALYLALPVGILILTDGHSWRRGVLTLAIAAAIAGWWYYRNLVLYKELTGISLFMEQVPGVRKTADTMTFATRLYWIEYTFRISWARFGYESISVPKPLLLAFGALVVASLVGLISKLVKSVRAKTYLPFRSAATRRWLVIGFFALGWVLAVINVVSLIGTFGAHGRLLLPGLAAFGVLMSSGLDEWTPKLVRWRVALSTACVLGVVAATCLFVFYYPAYQPSRVPATIDHPLDYRYEGVAELIGAAPAVSNAYPGDQVTITLYWRALHPGKAALLTYLNSADGDLVKVSSYPGMGNLLAANFQPGQTWAEQYVVTIPDDASRQKAYALVAGLFDPTSDRGLDAVNAQGDSVTPVVGRLVIHDQPRQMKPAFQFEDVLGLMPPQVRRSQDQAEVCLTWVSLAPTTIDYHMFIHVLDTHGQTVTQNDAALGEGQFPTSVWLPGEVVNECSQLEIPAEPAGLTLAVGLYNLADGVRLTVKDDQGRLLPDNQITLSPFQ